MAISKENIPQSNATGKNERMSHSPRPSGVAGMPISSRPSGVDARTPSSNPSSDDHNPMRASSVENNNSNSRPSSVARKTDPPTDPSGKFTEYYGDPGSTADEMGYGRIVRVVMASVR